MKFLRQSQGSSPEPFSSLRRRTACAAEFIRQMFLPATGLLALVWFLVRVIPKPSRAMYPCQRAAFPIASAFVIWVLGFVGMAASLRKGRSLLRESRRSLAAVFFFAAFSCFCLTQSMDATRARADYAPADPPNTPLGVPKGIYPGRVVWVHDPAATHWDPAWNNRNDIHYWDDNHTSQTVVDQMMSRSVRELTGQSTDAAAWDALFRHFNQSKGRGDVPYSPGQKIAIKLNHVEQRWHPSTNSSVAGGDNVCDLSPQVVEALLKQLVVEVGVPENRITAGDPSRFVEDKTFDRCHALFPGVIFIETNHYNLNRNPGTAGRVLTQNTTDTLIRYSGLSKSGLPLAPDKLPLEFYEADYVINLGILKGHTECGITFSGKNWFGCLGGKNPNALHDFWVNAAGISTPNNYRAHVDLMGHEHLGGKTMLYLLDGLYGFQRHGESSPLSRPAKWSYPPFNNDYPSSLLASLDPVALDSVGHDFLHAQFADNMGGTGLTGAIDDYLHEAALAHDPPSGTLYDPEADGTRLASLGVHEHWNNPTEKLYAKNMNTGEGIELLAVSTTQTRARGTVQIQVTPPEATWSLSGPERIQRNGAGNDTLTDTPTGNYVVTLHSLPGWITPEPAMLTLPLDADATITFEAVYTPDVSRTSNWICF